MKAAVVKVFGQPLIVGSVPDPVLRGPNDALVRVHASGVCHTDLHAATGDWPVKPRLPFIPGHEGVGVVEAIGENVTHIKVGDWVGVPWLTALVAIADTVWRAGRRSAQHNKTTVIPSMAVLRNW